MISELLRNRQNPRAFFSCAGNNLDLVQTPDNAFGSDSLAGKNNPKRGELDLIETLANDAGPILARPIGFQDRLRFGFGSRHKFRKNTHENSLSTIQVLVFV